MEDLAGALMGCAWKSISQVKLLSMDPMVDRGRQAEMTRNNILMAHNLYLEGSNLFHIR